MPFCPVSVVIPTYNRQNYLKRAIDSVCKQTLSCTEIIVVNDGSTDDSVELLQTIRRNNSIPLTIINTSNCGVAAARNTGIKNANNEVIAFLDSDDHWNKRKLEKQYQALQKNSDFLISHTKEKWLRQGKHLNQKKKHIPRQGDIFSHCLELCAVGMSTVMLNRTVFEKVGYFDEQLQCCEDYDLWLRMSCWTPFLLIDLPLTIKEGGREDQLSYIYRLGMDEKRIYSIRKLLDSDLLQSYQRKSAFKELEKKIRIFAEGCIKHGKSQQGNSYLELLETYR